MSWIKNTGNALKKAGITLALLGMLGCKSGTKLEGNETCYTPPRIAIQSPTNGATYDISKPVKLSYSTDKPCQSALCGWAIYGYYNEYPYVVVEFKGDPVFMYYTRSWTTERSFSNPGKKQFSVFCSDQYTNVGEGSEKSVEFTVK